MLCQIRLPGGQRAAVADGGVDERVHLHAQPGGGVGKQRLHATEIAGQHGGQGVGVAQGDGVVMAVALKTQVRQLADAAGGACHRRHHGAQAGDDAVGVGVAGERAGRHRAIRRRGHGLLAGDERLDRIIVRDKFLDGGAHRGGVRGDIHRGGAGGQRRNRQAVDAGTRAGNRVGLADELLAAAVQRIKKIFSIGERPAGQPGGGQKIALARQILHRDAQVAGGVVGQHEPVVDRVIRGGHPGAGFVDVVQHVLQAVGGGVVINGDAVDLKCAVAAAAVGNRRVQPGIGERRGKFGVAERRGAGDGAGVDAGAAVGVVKLGDLEKIAGVRRAAERDGAGTRQLDRVRGGIVAGGDGVVCGRGDVVKHLLERVAG